MTQLGHLSSGDLQSGAGDEDVISSLQESNGCAGYHQHGAVNSSVVRAGVQGP